MTPALTETDLMPPPFADGLDDWSAGEGPPDGPTYERTALARIAAGDPDFGTCLELRKVGPVQRLRYMGEVPVRPGAFVEVAVRLKVLRGALPTARIAAWPGGAGGRRVPGLTGEGPAVRLAAHGVVHSLVVVVGPAPRPSVDLVWDARALYAHVGLDLVGPDECVARIEAVEVREVTARFGPGGRVLPGF